MTNKKDIILYLRTSSDEQDPRQQLADIQTIAPPGGEIIEERESAWKANHKRPAFEDILRRIRERKVAALYVWDYDRLFRNRTKAISFMRECEFYGTTVFSYRQQWFQELQHVPEPWGSMMRKFMFEILAWLAEEESSKKSERVRKAVVKTPEGTFSSYGAKWGRPAIRLDEEEVRRLHADGWSYRALAKKYKVSRTKIQAVIKS